MPRGTGTDKQTAGTTDQNWHGSTELYTFPCGKSLYNVGRSAWGSVTTWKAGLGVWWEWGDSGGRGILYLAPQVEAASAEEPRLPMQETRGSGSTLEAL